MKLTLSLSLLLASSVFAQSSSESVAASADTTGTSTSVSSVAAQISSTESPSSSTRSGSKTHSAGSSTASSAATSPSAAAAAAILPNGISQTCTDFLNALNSDSALASCTSPLLSTTAEFKSDSASSSSSSKLTSTLNTLCSASGCSDTLIRRHISNFYTACKAELTGASPNTNIRQMYDILYVLNPMRDAMCTKDSTTKQYCVLQSPTSASSSTGSKNIANGVDSSLNPVSDAVEQFKAYGTIHARSVSVPYYNLSPRQAETVLQSPNMTAIQNTGLPYLFTQASLEPSALCTKCTQAILAAYATWEKQIPYAFGLNNSPMLGGQAELWKQVGQKCGDGFLSVVNAVSGDANVSNGAVSVIPGLRSLMASAVMILGAWVIL